MTKDTCDFHVWKSLIVYDCWWDLLRFSRLDYVEAVYKPVAMMRVVTPITSIQHIPEPLRRIKAVHGK